MISNSRFELSHKRPYSLPKRTLVDIGSDACLKLKEKEYYRQSNLNDESVDSFVAPGTLFKVTTAERYAFKSAELNKVLKRLGNPDTPKLYFVIPIEQFENFVLQPYRVAKGQTLNGPPFKNVRQFVLGLDMTSSFL